MAHAPNPTGYKAHRKTPRVNRELSREIEIAWNREIPSNASQAIPWLVLSSFVDNLSHRIPDTAVKRLRLACEKRDVKEYLSVGAEFGLPQLHEDHASYFASASVFSLFKKFPWTEGGLNPRDKAIERFHEAELLCLRTNRRFIRNRQTDFASKALSKRLSVHQIFHLARRKIASWLGPCDSSAIFSSTRFGPGGCVGTSRPHTTPFYKLGVSDYTVTDGAYWLALRHVLRNEAWVRALLVDASGSPGDDMFNVSYLERDFLKVPLAEKAKAFDARVTIANYNKVTFVPKDAKTDRAIAVEPHLNVMLQLCVGDFLKEVLKRSGCDLKDQSRNQELARIASISDDADGVATIDLAMASDCLSVELVRELLPPEWFDLLDNLRSREGRIDGESVAWEKFSSMGNGFTFELESMIFYALAQSVSDFEGTTEWYSDTFGPAYKYAEVSVFGDDIIVPKRVVGMLVDILRFCGFRTNLDKTFTSGPFRESCGKDYYTGVLVRPFYMKRAISRTKDLVHLLNNIKGLVYDGLYELEVTLDLIESLIPPVLRKHLVGPRRTTGDEHIWACPDRCHTSFLVVWDTDIQNWRFPVMRSRPTCVPLSGRHMVGWAYTQFLYSKTGRNLLENDNPSYESNDSFSDHLSKGGSAGDVVLSGQSEAGRLRSVSLV